MRTVIDALQQARREATDRAIEFEMDEITREAKLPYAVRLKIDAYVKAAKAAAYASGYSNAMIDAMQIVAEEKDLDEIYREPK